MSSNSPMEQVRHELLSDVSDHVAAELQVFGVPVEKAEQIGTNIANHMAEHWGGQVIGFPKDYIFKLHARDLDIYNAFNGNNHGQLARSYRLSVRAIYKIVDRVRRREKDRLQGRLF